MILFLLICAVLAGIIASILYGIYLAIEQQRHIRTRVGEQRAILDTLEAASQQQRRTQEYTRARRLRETPPTDADRAARLQAETEVRTRQHAARMHR